MVHDPSQLPNFRNVSRAEISDVYAPFSGYCFLSLAKLARMSGVNYGNSQPIFCTRNRPTVHPKNRTGSIHGKGCACCDPRQGRPRKPYNRHARPLPE